MSGPVVTTGYLGWGNGSKPDGRGSSYQVWGPGGRWDPPGGDYIEDELGRLGMHEGADVLIVACNRFGLAPGQWDALVAAVQALVPVDTEGTET